MDAIKALQWQVAKLTAGVLVVLGIILAIVFKTTAMPLITGLFFGGIIGILTFRLLGISMEKSISMSPSRAQIYVSAQYFLRMAITGAALFVSVKVETLNIFTVALGLIYVKAVIYGLHLKSKRTSNNSEKKFT